MGIETRIMLFIFFLIGALCVTTIIVISYEKLCSIMKQKWYQLQLYWHHIQWKLQFIRRMWGITPSDRSLTLDVVFKLYQVFYERSAADLEAMQFDANLFPNGNTDLVNMYKWVSITRAENYEELDRLYLNETNGRIIYWGKSFNDIKFSVRSFGRLEIIPIDVPQEDTNPTILSLKLLKIQNTLYALDTEMALWILERRKFFNL